MKTRKEKQFKTIRINKENKAAMAKLTADLNEAGKDGWGINHIDFQEGMVLLSRTITFTKICIEPIVERHGDYYIETGCKVWSKEQVE